MSDPTTPCGQPCATCPGATTCPEHAHRVGAAAPIDPAEALARFGREATRGVVDTGRYRMRYYAWGEGPPLAFVPGLSDTERSFLLPVARLASDFRCIAYDRRGHGRSDQPDGGYDYSTLADDLEAVLAHYDVRDAVVVAHSMAGGEAVRHLTRHGTGRVARLVLVAPTLPFLTKTADNPMGVDAAMFEQLRAVIAKDLPAWAEAGVDPETVSYVEAHGTGTRMGDPIEIADLTQAYRAAGARGRGFCALGSLKSNVGHLDSAAGVAGLIKAVLALQHRQVPPSLHFASPNPEIDFASSPFRVATALADWQAPPGQPRRAGVSSFGISGTNAHVVLEEAPAAEAPEARSAERPAEVLCLSGRTSGALRELASRYASYLTGPGAEERLGDVCATANGGRSHFEERLAVVGTSGAEVAAKLSAFVGGASPANAVQCAPLSVENHQVPNRASTPITASPASPADVPSCALSPSPSAMFDAPANTETSVPTAPTGAPPSSTAWFSSTVSDGSSTGESSLADTRIVPAARSCDAPVVGVIV